jgi:hypothetical protein
MVIWYILWSFGIHIVWSFGIFYGNLVYFMVIWYILRSFSILYGNEVCFVIIWYILSRFGLFYHLKSSNPCSERFSD